MARGRMISKSLSTSEKFASLVTRTPEMCEFCHALYPLIVAHSDDFGRLQGDAFTVKHQCYPASSRSLAEFSAALTLLDGVELIAWYVVSGKRYVQIVQFEAHQQGLHKRTRSIFPRVPGSSGNEPEIPGQEKGRELNGRELKPPVVPQGGRRAKRGLNYPERTCPHLPRCESFQTCTEKILRESKAS